MVELLVTITIITILAGVVLGALNAARQSARQDKTRATIAKINHFVMEMYDSYRTRRVPINTAGLAPPLAAQVRLAALRDTMRMEMPDRWSDIFAPPLTMIVGGNTYSVPVPAVCEAYRRQIRAKFPGLTDAQILNALTTDPVYRNHGSAECLFMIVTMRNAEAREQLNESDIGDVNANGFREFLDGWGNPIQFLRWAPGFNDSDVQPSVMVTDSQTVGVPTANPQLAVFLNARTRAIQDDHDPFDPRRVDIRPDPNNAGHLLGAWRVVPLIFSAGPDGIYDLSGTAATSLAPSTTTPPLYPYDQYPPSNPCSVYYDATRNVDFMIGSPVDYQKTSPPYECRHYDNIHNHRLEVK